MAKTALIVGNWKMNGGLASNKMLVTDIISAINGEKLSATLVVCCPSPYLSQVQQLTNDSSLALAAQDVSEHDQGAFTGEVSAQMLTDFGCAYGLVGHSERREYHRETDQQVMSKAKQLQKHAIVPIVCVGETLEQREQDQTLSVIAEQLSGIASLDSDKLVIAYEPVWAIGTGKTASPEQAQEVHQFIRQQLGEAGATTSVLYGGSVKPGNATELFSKPDIDGALIGGASLKASDFIAIAKAV